jgi:proton-dependent oligopeptide transporter, POT family
MRRTLDTRRTRRRPGEAQMDATTHEKFPKAFWSANVTELFERAAYYSMASFVVIYLGQLGFGAYWPSNLNGLLWTLVFFLPILSGTIADQVGFRRSLLVAFVLLAAGYTLMGYPIWFGGADLAPVVGKEFTAPAPVVAAVVAGIVLIGAGGSVIKPCVSGTVQKTAGARATLGFAIFYMVINIGSLFGRGTGYVVRRGYGTVTVLEVVLVCAIAAAVLVYLVNKATEAKERGRGARMTIPFVAVIAAAVVLIAGIVGGAARVETGNSLSYIFAVAACASVTAFFVVLAFYKDPPPPAGAPAKPRRSIGRILVDMVLVLRNGPFTLFLVLMSGFYFVYNQVYNVLPLYAKRVIETDPAMDLYTAANPLVIVCLQLAITQYFGRMKAIRSIVVGTVIIGMSMLINVYPIYSAGGLRAIAANWLPLGSVFLILTVALIAFGELFTSARMYEYIGSLAPKGQEGLFLGYANLPLALGALTGGPAGAFIFNDIMAKGASTRADGLLELVPAQAALGWSVLMGVGFLSALAMWIFNRWLERQPPAR